MPAAFSGMLGLFRARIAHQGGTQAAAGHASHNVPPRFRPDKLMRLTQTFQKGVDTMRIS